MKKSLKSKDNRIIKFKLNLKFYILINLILKLISNLTLKSLKYTFEGSGYQFCICGLKGELV